MAQEYCRALYTGEVTTTASDQATLLTIDGTDVAGLTDDYALGLEIVALAIDTATPYTGMARRFGGVERINGALAASVATDEDTIGQATSNIQLAISGNNILVKGEPASAANTITRTFVRIFGHTEAIA
jgi:hypothetical protein